MAAAVASNARRMSRARARAKAALTAVGRADRRPRVTVEGHRRTKGVPVGPGGFDNRGGPGGPDDRGGPGGPFDNRGPDDHGGPGGPFDNRGPGGPFDPTGGPGYHGGPGGPEWGPPPPDLGWRGINEGRYDHQAFNYNGNWVQPIYNQDFNNWGFWFFGIWIPL